MKLKEIKRVGMLGGGVMGSGIAQSVVLTGVEVVIRDIEEKALEKTRSIIEEGRYGLKTGVERGKIETGTAEQARKSLTYTTKFEDLADCDMVIEAIPEKLELKQQLFGELSDLVGAETILATNTSGFPIVDVGLNVPKKDRLIGMHWFSPANIMKAVEVIDTPDTSEETKQTLYDLCDAMGKVTIKVKDQPEAYGFVGNRIYFEMMKAAQAVLAEGIVNEEDLNAVFRFGFAWPVGPTEMGRGAQSGWT